MRFLVLLGRSCVRTAASKAGDDDDEGTEAAATADEKGVLTGDVVGPVVAADESPMEESMMRNLA